MSFSSTSSRGSTAGSSGRVDLAHLAVFAAVVDEGSFDAAARRLHVTPSAVSQRVKALESRMGQVLLKRTRPVVATEAGAVLVRLAGQIALVEGEALAALTGTPAGAADGSDALRRQRLPIAVNADSLATWFLPALAALTGAPAGTTAGPVTFDIRQEDQDHSATLLRDGSVMAAVTADARAVQGCAVEPLGAMRYLAVASPAFRERWFGGNVDDRADDLVHALDRAPMLVYNRKDALQRRFADDLAGRSLDPPVTFLPSSTGFLDAARIGLAWGMVPEAMAASELQAGRLVEIAPGRHLDVPLYWQRWRLDSPVLAALTDAVRAEAGAALRRPG